MQSLAVKYRPKEFEDVCGQSSIIKILKQQLATNTIKNCYLFCGPSGTGKTTLSKILAKKINKGEGFPIEIDAASNSGVDNVRDIIADAQLRAVDAEYKVFIIDECHSISNAGWQAFLKTLEEPPHYTIFMFCTTNPEKVPVTIQNRVMRFNLTKIPTVEITKRLEYICAVEGFTNYSESCDYIAKISNGGARDAIATLEKVADYSKDIDIKNTLEVLGSYSYNDFFDLIDAISDIRESKVLEILERLDMSGRDLKNFVEQYISFVLDLAKYALFKDIATTRLPLSLEDRVKYSVGIENNIEFFNSVIDYLLLLKNNVRYDDNANLTIKASFVHILENTRDLWMKLSAK